MELFVFVCASFMILGGAIGVVVRSNPVHAALSLVLTLFGIAVLFVAQHAEFLAAVQVIVVLFLFVIMLLGVDRAEDLRTSGLAGQRGLAAVVGVGLLGVLGTAIVRGTDAVVTRSAEGIAISTVADADANIVEIARSIFGDHVVAFELTSVLLVVAVVGTVLLSRRRPTDVRPISGRPS